MKCEICNYEEWPEVRRLLKKKNLCWSCNFWWPFLQHKLGARYRGVHYMMFGDLEPNVGGTPGTWEFTFGDGRVIMCRNVTCQGAIPERFLLELPNNVVGLRTTWRSDVVLPESLGFGNCTVRVPIMPNLSAEGHQVAVQLPKLKAQQSLFDLL